MTDQQSEMDQQTRQPQKQPAKSSGVSADAIALGLEFLFSRRRQAAWSLRSGTRESAAWVTAYVLARLGEVPPQYLNFTQRQQIEESLDWLMEARTPQNGWSFGGHGSDEHGAGGLGTGGLGTGGLGTGGLGTRGPGTRGSDPRSATAPDDADSTAWAVAALRQHGRPVPQGALQLIHRCRRPDGGYALHLEAGENNAVSRSSAADVTAIAVRALSAIDAASSEFLAGHLRTDIESGHGRVSSAFFVSSTLMDWEPCMAPWFVVNAVRQLVAQQEAEGAWEQALLLRCRMRLQMQSAWPLAATLRRAQRPDGSWPGLARLATFQAGPGGEAGRHDEYFDEDGVLATVTAVSALAIGDLQPGLYFGSDLPFRRL